MKAYKQQAADLVDAFIVGGMGSIQTSLFGYSLSLETAVKHGTSRHWIVVRTIARPTGYAGGAFLWRYIRPWSRKRAIRQTSELIEELERYVGQQTLKAMQELGQ